MKIFGLGQRELNRTQRMTNASDLSSRQLALVMASCLSYVSAADLLSTGGDAEACMQHLGVLMSTHVYSIMLSGTASFVSCCMFWVVLRKVCWRSRPGARRSRRTVPWRTATFSRRADSRLCIGVDCWETYLWLDSRVRLKHPERDGRSVWPSSSSCVTGFKIKTYDSY